MMNPDKADTFVSKRAGPTPAEWEEKRPIITRLFRDEGRTHNDIARVMRERYQFYASRRMYQRRTSKWGLDKKCKYDEMIFVHQIMRKRLSEGKDTQATIRGKEVSHADIEKYWKRRPLRDLRQCHNFTMQDCPQDVRISTPSPEKRQVLYLEQNVSVSSVGKTCHSKVVAVRDVRKNQSSQCHFANRTDSTRPSYSCNITTSFSSLQAQKFVSAFNQSFWDTRQLYCLNYNEKVMVYLRHHLTEFSDESMVGMTGITGGEAFILVRSAVDHYNTGNSRNGMKDLDLGFDGIKKSLFSQGPRLLLDVFDTLGRIKHFDPASLSSVFLRYTYQMSQEVLGATHPFVVLIAQLGKASQVQNDLLPYLAIEILNHVSTQANVDLSLRMFAFHNASSACKRMGVDVSEAGCIHFYKQLLNTCDAQSERWFNCCLHLFHACIELQELEIANEMLKNMECYFQTLYDNDIPPPESLFLMAHHAELLFEMELFDECHGILQDALHRYAGLVHHHSMRIVALRRRITKLMTKGYYFDYSACPALE